MRFSGAICLTFGTLALASPSKVVRSDKRQLLPPPGASTAPLLGTVIDALTGVVNDVGKAIPNINGTINDILSTTNTAPSEAVSQLTSALDPILDALQLGAGSLFKSTGSNLIETVFLLSGLTNAQVGNFATAIGKVDGVFDELNKVLQGVKGFEPEVRGGINDALAKLFGGEGDKGGKGTSVSDFFGQLGDVGGATQLVGQLAGLNTDPLSGALGGLSDVLDDLTSSLGLENILDGLLGGLLGGLGGEGGDDGEGGEGGGDGLLGGLLGGLGGEGGGGGLLGGLLGGLGGGGGGGLLGGLGGR